MRRLLLAIAALAGAALLRAQETNAAAPAPPASGPTVETLVCIRHGEKTGHELGQLTAQGLNRALALPPVLIGKFGKPDFIFAPDPAEQFGWKGENHSYVRPLATIEPTAIYAGLPVNTQFGLSHYAELARELDDPRYANATVFIAWEHWRLEKFVRQVITEHGGDATPVPKWDDNDYDSIYVVKITRPAGGAATAAFTLEHEGLDNLSKKFPSPAAP